MLIRLMGHGRRSGNPFGKRTPARRLVDRGDARCTHNVRIVTRGRIAVLCGYEMRCGGWIIRM
jgi:hypothetical protein